MTGGFSYVLDEKRSFFENESELINLDRVLSETMDPHRQNLKLLIKGTLQEYQEMKAKEILKGF
ncbi:MAG: hypothetical protein Ct9H90mP6_10270 [Gammaproteobacteria bacterium]|nr:MAG: hypothetical protein Ct9H90mP6_10270 [Gammaproteobacteria bacterium]